MNFLLLCSIILLYATSNKQNTKGGLHMSEITISDRDLECIRQNLEKKADFFATSKILCSDKPEYDVELHIGPHSEDAELQGLLDLVSIE